MGVPQHIIFQFSLTTFCTVRRQGPYVSLNKQSAELLGGRFTCTAGKLQLQVRTISAHRNQTSSNQSIPLGKMRPYRYDPSGHKHILLPRGEHATPDDARFRSKRGFAADPSTPHPPKQLLRHDRGVSSKQHTSPACKRQYDTNQATRRPELSDPTNVLPAGCQARGCQNQTVAPVVLTSLHSAIPSLTVPRSDSRKYL